METDAGDKNDDEVETEVFVGADLLVDKVWPCDSNKAKMLLSVWHVMFKQKNLEERPKKTAERTLWDEQHSVKETLCAAESHDWCSELLGMCMPKDWWPLAPRTLLVVNSFELHLNASKLWLPRV